MGAPDLSAFLWPDVGQGRQPQNGILQVDWENPITRELSIASTDLFDVNLASGAKQTKVVTTGGATPAISSAGRGMQFSGATAFTGSGNILGSDSFTLLFICNPNTQSARVFHQEGSVGSIWAGINVDENADSAGLNTVGVGYLQNGVVRGKVVASFVPDGNLHCFVVGKSPTEGHVYKNGVKQSVTATGLSASPTSSTDTYQIGGLTNWSPSSLNAGLFLLLVWKRLLSESEVRKIVENPQQIFAPQSIPLLVATAGGSNLAASASGYDTASGAATPNVQVALAGIGVSSAGGSATAGVSIPLSAAGIDVSTGSANTTATVTISASGLAQAAGQAGLSASVLLAAAGAAITAGNAPLAVQLLAQASGSAQAAGNSALAAQIAALASGIDVTSGTANLTASAIGELSASGGDVSSGSAVLSVNVQLTATGGDQASGTATGTATAPGTISASGGDVASGSATVSATVEITAAGFVQAMGSGQFSVQVENPLYTNAPTGNGYWRPQITVSRPTMLASRRHVQRNTSRR